MTHATLCRCLPDRGVVSRHRRGCRKLLQDLVTNDMDLLLTQTAPCTPRC